MSTAADVARQASGRRISGGFMIRCPAAHHDDETPSCKVYDGPDGRAMFHCFAGCYWRDDRAGAEALGLIPETQISRVEHVPLTLAQKAIIERARNEQEARESRSRDQKQKWARSIWRASIPIEKTPARRYLTSRSLHGPYPPTLRFHDNCKHPITGGYFPAMVGAVTTGEASEPDAVHLTFLSREGVAKADISHQRIIIGPAGGGAIRLGEPEGSLALAEGIETALSIQQEASIPTWCCMSASMMRLVKLPPRSAVQKMFIAADGDKPGLIAARELAARVRENGQVAHIVSAPAATDWNDVLMGNEE